jgi:uncharacterized protein (DUF1778 family)
MKNKIATVSQSAQSIEMKNLFAQQAEEVESAVNNWNQFVLDAQKICQQADQILADKKRLNDMLKSQGITVQSQ